MPKIAYTLPYSWKHRHLTHSFIYSYFVYRNCSDCLHTPEDHKWVHSKGGPFTLQSHVDTSLWRHGFVPANLIMLSLSMILPMILQSLPFCSALLTPLFHEELTLPFVLAGGSLRASKQILHMLEQTGSLSQLLYGQYALNTFHVKWHFQKKLRHLTWQDDLCISGLHTVSLASYLKQHY